MHIIVARTVCKVNILLLLTAKKYFMVKFFSVEEEHKIMDIQKKNFTYFT